MLLSETLAPAAHENADFSDPMPSSVEAAIEAIRALQPGVEAARQAYNVQDNRHLDAMHGRGRPKASPDELAAVAAEERAAHDAWLAERDRIADIAIHILTLPVASAADVYAKQRAFYWAHEGKAPHLGLNEGYDLPNEEVHEAHEALQRDLVTLTAPQPPSEPSPPFRAALVARRAAVAAYEATLAKVEEATDALDRDAPKPEILIRPNGGRYFNARDIESAPLPFGERMKMMKAFEKWRPLYDAALAKHDPEGIEEREVIPAMDAADETLDVGLVELTPSTPADLVILCREIMTRYFADWAGEHADDPATIQRLAQEDFKERAVLWIFRAALRLAGEHDAVALTTPDWDAEAWINDYEQATGFLMHDGGPRWRDDEVEDRAAVEASLARWKALRPWQQDDVRDLAKKRGDYFAGRLYHDARPADVLHWVAEQGGELTVTGGNLTCTYKDGARESYLRYVRDYLNRCPALKDRIVSALDAEVVE